MQQTDKLFIPGFILIAVLVFYGTGCETGFDPLQENDQYRFSMYGVLDLHADTQWVRVMPIQDTLTTHNPEPTDTEVVLIRESTGDHTALHDSLFLYGNLAYAWNFLTSEPLHPNEEYTIRAESPGGEFSSVFVTIPRHLPVAEVQYTIGEEEGRVTGSGIENLVAAEVTFLITVTDEFGFTSLPFDVVYSYLSDASVEENGDYSFPVFFWPLIREEVSQNHTVNVHRRTVLVASGSKDWPDLSGLNEEEIVLPEGVSNVENGTGLVAGIASRSVVLRNCFEIVDMQLEYFICGNRD